MGDFLMIGGGLAGVVEVGFAHVQWVQPQFTRDMIHHPFNPQHPLRAAKSAVCGGGLGVGFQTVGFNPDIRQVIGIVGMQHRAVSHRKGQILRPAATGELQKLQPQYAAGVIHTCAVGNAEIMALAGDDHIIIAVIAHFAGLAGQTRGNRTGAGQSIALTFLAAKAPAHATGFDADGMHGFANGLGDLVLNFSGVLGGGVHQHVPTFLRKRDGGLTLKVKMFLSAHVEHAFYHVRSFGDGIGRGAFFVDAGAILEPGIGGKRVFIGEYGRKFFVFDLPQFCGLAGGKVAGGDNKEHGLPDVMDRAC